MVITLTASTLSSGISINAPTHSTTLAEYLQTIPKVAVSLPTTATGTLLTAMGRYTANDSVWRIRNGIGLSKLSAYGGGFTAQYDSLPTATDTFVLSPIFKTHVLETAGGTLVKAAGTQIFNNSSPLNDTDQYTINGSNGNDTLSGANAADTIEGKGGNDTLTGGSGSDHFVFSHQGVDVITDFSASDNDVFAIKSANYDAVAAPNTPLTTGEALNAQANSYIMIDTSEKIASVSSGNSRLAYNTSNNTLLYDNDGNWSNGGAMVMANVTLTGNLSANNFSFI
ncbi:calcium-binding protein [Gloeothece verrucosa]|uniref:Hemolysin-type calcium-binding region n=1 Tax=Gloeothece verrucosa (strain PCC 7822) TaxID=497965 RepID=E0U6U4_GLOV7|nr:calcium-binding protein [Gloeothece verrucosa]ADN15981.1 Hemolysin-type calcium-binding region [Gloeothece verrucosa PCC 7822]